MVQTVRFSCFLTFFKEKKMLRKIMGFLFGFITFLSGMSILAITLLQGQARIDKSITPPGYWDLAIVASVGIIFLFLTLAIWPKDEGGHRNNIKKNILQL
jgi:hypothetical protein